MCHWKHKIQSCWYQHKSCWLAKILLPLAGLYWFVIVIRRFLYKHNLFTRHKLKFPTIIVGNITIGGTGKTPVVIYLVHFLQAQGFYPGVISRGYKGKNKQITLVTPVSDPFLVGDEPVVIAKRTQCPIVVGRDKVAAGKYLQDNFPINIIICDDGLQHYALQRDIELVVIDGLRRFGNGYCLPSGPLRELPSRLQKADALLVNGGVISGREFAIQTLGEKIYNLGTLNYSCKLSDLAVSQVHAVAGIGEPNRFFDYLRSKGLAIIPHIFPDHHNFIAMDLNFAENLPIIMTEKDAVKCKTFATNKHWFLPIEVILPPDFNTLFLQLINKVKDVK